MDEIEGSDVADISDAASASDLASDSSASCLEGRRGRCFRCADVSFDTSLRFWQLVWDASRNKGKRPD